jgi:hypothetical protein
MIAFAPLKHQPPSAQNHIALSNYGGRNPIAASAVIHFLDRTSFFSSLIFSIVPRCLRLDTSTVN